MQDAWRAYLEVALGLTEASRKRATKVARDLVGKGGATAEQLQALAEDLVNTGMANREALTKLVRYELDRALGAVGLATVEDVADLRGRVRELEQQLREARSGTTAAAATPVPGGAEPAGPATAVAPSTLAKKAVAGKAAAGKAVAKRTVAKKVVAKKVVAKKAVAKKATTGRPGAS